MRIVTRPDFDGIVCAVLLIDALDIQKPVKWVEPNQMHRGLVDIQEGDIIANLSYDKRCSLWFDHHASNRIKTHFNGLFRVAPSAAGIIFDYFKKEFKRDFSKLVEAADKIDSANLTIDEVLYPDKYPYVLLSNTISSQNRDDRSYWDSLVDLLGTTDINKILKDPQVKARVKSTIKENQAYKKLLKQNTRLINQVSITDFRSLDISPTGNRFLVFSLYPTSSVNIKIRIDPLDREMVIVSIGHSIFNRTCRVNIGDLCSRFGGGGHKGAGSCSFPISQSEKNIQEIIDILTQDKKNKD